LYSATAGGKFRRSSLAQDRDGGERLFAGVYVKQQLKDKLIEHKQYIAEHGQELPEVRNWQWRAPVRDTEPRSRGRA